MKHIGVRRGLGLLLVLVTVGVVSQSCGWIQTRDYIKPGEYGVLITYKDPSQPPEFQPESPGTTVTYRAWDQALARYPASQQSLVMVRAENEGAQKGDDSTPCTLKDGTQVRVDSTTQWRVKPDGVGNLYLLHPNTPLTGKFNEDLSSTLVRGIVIHAISVECAAFTYTEYTQHEDMRDQFNKDVAKRVSEEFERTYLVLDGFFTRPFHPNDALQASLNEAASAEQRARQATFDALASKTKADQDAANITTINTALANAPEYIKYLEASKWDGHLPAAVSNGSSGSGGPGMSILVPIPSPVPASTNGTTGQVAVPAATPVAAGH
jgi:regulator of protease activity HflC (stomatin/prohibitin superfamily)